MPVKKGHFPLSKKNKTEFRTQVLIKFRYENKLSLPEPLMPSHEWTPSDGLLKKM